MPKIKMYSIENFAHLFNKILTRIYEEQLSFFFIKNLLLNKAEIGIWKSWYVIKTKENIDSVISQRCEITWSYDNIKYIKVYLT